MSERLPYSYLNFESFFSEFLHICKEGDTDIFGNGNLSQHVPFIPKIQFPAKYEKF